MKKSILMVLLTFLFLSVKAQSKYCKYIDKSNNEFTETTTYCSPRLQPITFYVNFVKGVKTNSIVASCLSYTANYDTYGIYIKLDDGTILKSELSKALVRYDGNDKYDYYSQLDIADSDIQELILHKIISYGIGSMVLDVKVKDAIKYQAYITCLSSVTNP
jgi:hypothetical protein